MRFAYFYLQVAAENMNGDFVADFPKPVRCRNSRAGSRAAGEGFAAAPFPNANFQLVFAEDLDEAHVGSFGKSFMVFNYGADVFDWEFVNVFDEYDAVGVAHGKAVTL